MTDIVLADSADVDIRFDFANVNGIRLHYAQAGQGPLLLCLHGFPEFWRSWRFALLRLSDRFHVVAPDLRGYNLSDKPQSVMDYRVDEVVADVLALAQHFGAETFNLAAHDWGGMAGWHLAARHPQRVRRLGILNSPHPQLFQRELRSNPRQIAASQYIQKFLLPSAEEKLSHNDYDLLWRFAMAELVAKEVMSDVDRRAHVQAWSQPGALTAMLNWYRAASFGAAKPKTSAPDEPMMINVPTKVIWGVDDTALQVELLNGLEQLVPELSLLKIAGAGHGVHHEQPERVAAALREFFRY